MLLDPPQGSSLLSPIGRPTKAGNLNSPSGRCCLHWSTSFRVSSSGRTALHGGRTQWSILTLWGARVRSEPSIEGDVCLLSDHRWYRLEPGRAVSPWPPGKFREIHSNSPHLECSWSQKQEVFIHPPPSAPFSCSCSQPSSFSFRPPSSLLRAVFTVISSCKGTPPVLWVGLRSSISVWGATLSWPSFHRGGTPSQSSFFRGNCGSLPVWMMTFLGII